MALIDDLVAWYAMEERFDEAIAAVNSVPPNAMPLESVNSPGAGTGGQFVQSVAGKIGRAAKGTEAASTIRLEAAEHAIARLDRDKTFAFWMRWDDTRGEQTLLGKVSDIAFEYYFGHDSITPAWKFSSATHSLVYPVIPSPFQWYCIIIWYDHSASKVYMRVNGGVVVSATFVVTAVPGVPFVTGLGPSTIDELGIWDRILTAAEQDEFYNNGEGLTYEDITVEAAAAACRELECCDDDPAEYVSTGGTGQGFDSNCEPLPRVMFEPTSGTRLIMPSLVMLRTDIDGAVIHYTTDGSGPDRNSAIYTSPITVDAPADIIRAIAIVEGCPEGPESVAQYQQWSPAAHFTYGCGVVDKSGQWGAWGADGNPDYNWQVQIQFAAITGIKRFDVLQLFPDGTFTGSAWSTDEFIYPWEYDHTKQHRAFPLVIWNPDHTGAQVNIAYVSDFSVTYGNFAVGAHILTLYGSPWTTLLSTHVFKLRMTFQDGTYIEKVVDSTCDVLPTALCPVPSLTLTPACGPYRIDVTFALGVGTPHAIGRRLVPYTGDPDTIISSGAVASNPQTVQDTAVTPGAQYEYWIANQPASCADLVYGPMTPVHAPPLASVQISASPSVVGSTESTTISWNSQNNAGTVSISPTIGAQPGNVPGNQVLIPGVTTTYVITGQDACGTVSTAQVTVTVLPPATCGSSPPSALQISGYADSFFNLSACAPPFPPPGPVVVWPGYLNLLVPGACEYGVPAGWSVQGGTLNHEATLLTLVGGVWRLEIWIDGVMVWRGTKGFGTSPVGVYTQSVGFGCSATPGSLTLVEIATATCGTTQPGDVEVRLNAGTPYADNMFVGAFGGCPALGVGVQSQWDGRMSHRPWVGLCQFLTDYSVSTFIVNGGGRRVMTRAQVRIVANRWTLTIQGYQSGADVTVWEGEKASGDTPVGLYVRTDGCDSTIPQVTLVAV